MPVNTKSRLPLFVILTIFIGLKLPYLHYAYYWDESWPYAVAIKAMYHHGVSLMPTAIDSELSRGHPLFFHAIAATWMNIFGDSHISMHSFALFISVVFLIAIYETALRMFDQRVAVLALILVIVQEMFFIQSSLVLFEMLVAFLCFSSLVFYVREKYFLTALCLTMLFYTKESGLVAGIVLGIDAFFNFLNKNAPLKLRIYKLVSVGVPCLFIGVFFVMQKHLRGWYIFPLYSDCIKHSFTDFWYLFRIGCVKTVFIDQLRFCYFMLLVLLAVVAAVRQRKLKPLTILLPAICIYYLIDDTRAGRLLPGIPFFIVFILSVIWLVYSYPAREYYSDRQRKLIRINGWFVICFLCFSSLNFFTPRYMLAAIIPTLFISAVFMNTLIKHAYVYVTVLIIILSIGGYAYMLSDAWGDCEHGIFDGLKVQQGVADYFEKNVPRDQYIGALSMEGQHLSNPATGFLHSDRAFTNVSWDINANTHYAIFDNIENDTRYAQIKNDTCFYPAKRIEKGNVWAEIYKRK